MEIGKFEKNKREIVVAELTEWRGHQLFCLRVLVRTSEGALLPTKKGLSISQSKLPELKRLILEAEGELAKSAGANNG